MGQFSMQEMALLDSIFGANQQAGLPFLPMPALSLCIQLVRITTRLLCRMNG